MILREQLAGRLADIKWPGMSQEPGAADCAIDAAQGNMATWGDLADECIRQMDYNARRAFDSCCSRGELGQELTLAPEGWKP